VNDLALSPLKADARSNLYVYVEGRRFTFYLSTVAVGGDGLVIVRDAPEQIEKGCSREK